MERTEGQLRQLEELWELHKGQDDRKHSLITNLFGYVSLLRKELDGAEMELRNRKDLIHLLRTRETKTADEIKSLNLEKDRHVFALVLVDGDCMPFRDELVKQGLEGGRRTTNLLKQAVEQDLEVSVGGKIPHIQVVVRVYANVKGLAKVYKETEILPNPTILDEFIRGFNMVDALFDFVDAGNGKECSDEKVKGVFQLNLADVHCRQILFGGSTDNGYARLLGKHIDDEEFCRRVTLLQGPPFAQELADIKGRFRVALFDAVFRSLKLPNIKRRVSFHLTPPSTPKIDYSKVAARPAPSAVLSAGAAHKVPVTDAGPSSAGPIASGIRLNKLGQRVDVPLEYNQHDFNRLKARRLCNNFHILGKCPFLEQHGNCLHEHGERLSKGPLQALCAIARLSPCQQGLHCSDPRCIAGHRCTKVDCPQSPGSCRFPPDMHEVDIRFA